MSRYRVTTRIKFEPRDLWVGVFVDTDKQRLYICLLPCFPIVIGWEAA